MITAIGTIIISARGAMLKDAIKVHGSYHGALADVEMDVVSKLKDHVGVDEVGLVKAEGHGALAETTEREQEQYGMPIPYRYIEIQGYDEKAGKLLPIKLSEGRLPESSSEIIIEKWVLRYIDENLEVGDKIRLNIGERDIKYAKDEEGYNNYIGESFQEIGEREYTLVGFINPRYNRSGDLITKGIIGMDEVYDYDEANKYGAYFTLDNIDDALEKVNDIGANLGVEKSNVSINGQVLRYYAQSGNPVLDRSLMGIVIFVISLIMISTIAVIYNSFNISVIERISQFGLLRSIGATPKQIRTIVLKEAGILSAIGIPIGLLSGVAAMKIVFHIIALLVGNNIDILGDMEVSFSIIVFGISIILGLVTVFLSAIIPARQAGKVSPLDAVRNTGDIKKERFKVGKSSKIIRKIFGIEGEIAHKNLRRNRKRFIITVFSMVISIILFITFSTFSDYIFKIGAIDSGKIADYKLFGKLDSEFDEIYKDLMDIEDVERVYKVRHENGEALLGANKISKKLIEYNPDILNAKENNLVPILNVGLYTIGDDNFDILKGLLNSGRIDKDKLNENGVLVINNTYTYKGDTGIQTLIEGFNLKEGDSFNFASYRGDDNREYTEFTVVGVLEKGILDFKYNDNTAINIIVSEKVWDKIYYGENKKEELDKPFSILNVEIKEGGDKENIKTYLDEIEDKMPELQVIDIAERAKQERNMAIVMSIFLYGFITLIALISAINILNTISTNILLRTKEIAMIKAVGMAQKGIRKMVAFESLFYGLYATIFGGTIGVGLTYILHTFFIGISEFEYRLPWKNVAITCIASGLIALISGAYPLKRINENIIVESMKAEN